MPFFIPLQEPLPSEILNYLQSFFLTHKKRIFFLLKLLFLFLLSYSIYSKLVQNEDLENIYSQFQKNLNFSQYPLWFLVSVLMLVNWSIEAFKWRILIEKVEKISFFKAFQAICSGITLAMFTPNRIGEFGGRVLLLKNANKIQGISMTLIGSFSQIVASFNIGFWGWMGFYHYFVGVDAYISYILLCTGLLLTSISFFFYFNIHLLKNLVGKIPFIKNKQAYFNPVFQYSVKELNTILMLSALRHGVFSFQYCILFSLLGIKVAWWEGLLLVFSIFFVQTVIPSIAIVELGIRGRVALYFMGYVTQNHLAVLTASFMLWGINLLIPALIGMGIIFSLNIKNESHK